MVCAGTDVLVGVDVRLTKASEPNADKSILSDPDEKCAMVSNRAVWEPAADVSFPLPPVSKTAPNPPRMKSVSVSPRLSAAAAPLLSGMRAHAPAAIIGKAL